MKIALIGYGQMGHMIEQIALNQGHSIVARVSSDDWNQETIQQADVCIEFTHPDCVLSNIERLATLKKQLVIGTTGWYDKMDEVRKIIDKSQIGALYAPNFSMGVNLLFEILRNASRLISPFLEYDVGGIEYHHHKKKDKPSGTALEIQKIIEENMERPDAFSFYSIRCGSIPGTHSILFDSPADTITITHEARNREGFARGAIHAAEWIQGKKGLFTYSQCMQEIINRRSSSCCKVQSQH